MTANEVVERIKKNLGIPWNEQTYRDTFKAGDPNIEVKGIATTFMATLDQIQRSHAAGLNFVITHEPTFWNDADTVKDFAGDPIFKFKMDFVARNQMAIWRFHDHIHAHRPDLIRFGLARVLGWSGQESVSQQGRFELPTTTLGALAADVAHRLNAKALRVVGDPNAKVSTASLSMGYGMPRVSADIDVVVGGETPETDGPVDDTEYVADAAFFGRNKGQIIMGHEASEEPGMEDCANWLRTFITEVPIQFVKANEPYWSPKAG
jgi:putative NIF3 family GTP cyclohydrolase 1 type 2